MTEDHFRCGVAGCEYTRKARFEDFWQFQADAGHMYDHYRWEHLELVGVLKKGNPREAFSDYYEYHGIPEDVTPTLHMADGDTYTWKEVQEHIR